MLSVCQVDAPNGKNESKLNGPNIPLTLPAILGRGPLLKCSETKVSRRHASLDWDDEDGITIQALHNSPTLVMVSGVMSSLSKGKSLTLHHEDMFGLLPDSAWYRISLHNNKDTSSDVADANGSAAKTSPGETSLINRTSINKEEEIASQSSNASTADQQASNNALENSSKKKLLPDEIVPTTCEVTVMDEQCKEDNSSQFDEAKFHLYQNIIKQSASSASTVSDTNGESSKKASATRGNGNEPVQMPNKKPKLEVNSNLKDLVQAAVSHRVRTLPAWMKGLNVAPSTDASNGGAAIRGEKQGTSCAWGGRAAAPFNRAGNGQADEEQTASKAPPSKNKRRGKKPLSCPAEEQVGGSDSEPKQSSSSNSPTKPLSSTNTSPAKGSSANSTPTKPADRRGMRLHYMSDSESDECDAPTKSPAKATSDVLQAVHIKQVTPPAAELKKHDESQSSTKISGVGEANGKGLGSKSITDTISDSGSDGETEPSTSNGARRGRMPGTGPAAATPTSTASAAAGGGVKRKSCQYGASCYRCNPQHKRDEAHPGDADYTTGPESDGAGSGDDDRPECEFGVDCYRKNPQHRRQYKHTRLPQPQRQAKRKVRATKKRNADDIGDSDDSYDYDDPFFNDDSSDDYAPTDSESDSERLPSQPLDEEEKRDLKRMKKEAKKFVKGDK